MESKRIVDMIGRYRLFEVDKETGVHYFVYDFDTYYEALAYGKQKLRGFWTVKDSKNG